MVQLKSLCLLCLLCLLTSFAEKDVEEAPMTPRDLDATLDAIDAAVDFMGRHANRANLDGVIGLRTVEGQLTTLLARYWYRLPMPVASRMKQLQEKAGSVSNLAVESVQSRTPEYFANAGKMVRQHCWDTFYPARQLTDSSKKADKEVDDADGSESADYSEKFSDDCIGEFHGLPKCRISDACWNKIVKPRRLKDYSLTHQVFYLLNGIQANCLPNLTSVAARRSDSTVPQLLDGLCSRVAAAADSLAASGFPPPDRDLFMEQIGLCGIAGYLGIARTRWLPFILSWQRPNGCYGRFSAEILDPRNFDSGRYGSLRRRKRAESRMTDTDCLSHRTAVALNALIVYARRGVEQSIAK